jgi:hypothetical protein
MEAGGQRRILELMSIHGEYRQVFYKIMRFCMDPHPFMRVQEEILSYPEMETALQPADVLLKWLENAGGIVQFTEGEEGRWRTTEVGKKIVAQEAPMKKIQSLLDDEPDFREVFLELLAFCETPHTIAEIKDAFKGKPILSERNVYPAYFVHTLEEFGGLIWKDKEWRTTEAGKGVLMEKNWED